MMNNNLEIEKKYLMKNVCLKKLKKYILDKFVIHQYYLSNKEDLRIRKKQVKNNTLYTITLKKDTENPEVRIESEQAINEDIAKSLIKLSKKYLKKYRYICSYKQHTWEIDYYPEKDLWIAEIELSDKEQKFPLFPFIDEDVTKNPKYKNKNLAF